MEWQNYHHLFYFYTIVLEGGVAKAAEKLRLAPSTVSAQIKVLEHHLGEKLFYKQGRGLALTEAGQTVKRYAEEIFALGSEMRQTLKGRPSGRSLNLFVGITDFLPKLVTYLLLKPAFNLKEKVYLNCREDHLENLLSELMLHKLDVVLSDSPIPSSIQIKAYNHLIGECGLSFFVSSHYETKNKSKFPSCLENEDFLLPGPASMLRKNLEHWFEEKKIHPQFVAEIDDSALLKVFAQAGKGYFAAPQLLEKEIIKQYEVKCVGRTEEVKERFYVISPERKIKHPAVLAICESAREKFF